MRIKFHLRDFPRFRQEYKYDNARDWDESLHNAGYRSAEYIPEIGEWEMEEAEYTLFILRWIS